MGQYSEDCYEELGEPEKWLPPLLKNKINDSNANNNNPDQQGLPGRGDSEEIKNDYPYIPTHNRINKAQSPCSAICGPVLCRPHRR